MTNTTHLIISHVSVHHICQISSIFKLAVETPSILDLFVFQQFILLVALKNVSKMPLSMCAFMLAKAMTLICQCQPWILAKL